MKLENDTYTAQVKDTKAHLEAELRHTRAMKELVRREKDMTRTLARMDLIRSRAAAAAARLLEYRDPEKPMPQTEEQLMDLIDYMLKSKRNANGCPLMAYERKALAVWHLYRRATLAAQRKAEAHAPDTVANNPQ